MYPQVIKLNALCADPVVVSAADTYLAAKRNANTSEGADSASLTTLSEAGGSDPEKAWRWSGSNFVKSPTMEPWVISFYIYL